MLKSIVKKMAIANRQLTQHSQVDSTKKGQFLTNGWKPTPEMFFILLSSVAAVLSVSPSAFAQLNVGSYHVQPGLESEYLNYQMSGQGLSQMRGIPGCFVGFGLGCNKTGAVLSQLLESNGKSTYQDLLLRAAGGPENFQNFANFYGNNPNLYQIPYASFWQNDSPSIVDGYRYVLGSSVSSTPTEGLGSVTKNFYWAPVSGTDSSLSLRSGLLDLKYSFGRVLLEEVSKIPNVQQQIQSLGLPPQMTSFYQETLSKGLHALDTGNNQEIEHSILHLLSSPYTTAGIEYHRPNIGIPKEFDQLYGDGLPGDEFVGTPPILLDGDVGNIEIPNTIGEYFSTPEGSGRGFPAWLLAAGGLSVGLLLLLLSGGGGGKSSHGPSTLASNNTGSTPSMTPSMTPSPTPTVISTPPPVTQVTNVKIPEPSMVKSILLVVIVLWILSYKQWRVHKRA